jgi:hypothetical protein
MDIPTYTGYRHLVGKIGCKNYFLRWVRQTLTDDLRQKRIELAGQSLELLGSKRSVQFHGILTDNESWPLQYYDQE